MLDKPITFKAVPLGGNPIVLMQEELKDNVRIIRGVGAS